MDGFRTLDAGDVVEFDIRSEEKGIAAVDVLPVLTLGMMKQKAEKEHLHLEVALVKGYDNRGWMIVAGYQSQVISVITSLGDCVGAVIIFSENGETELGETEIKLAKAAAGFLGRQMEQ